MTKIHGFELLKDQEIPELNTKARYFRHVKTGAELISLENNDENKVFSINFRTPPEDSTGVAHILEHSVLNGSDKYPVKEPFIELVKGSLQTFVNAFTFSDKTCYPCASQNLQDFYNLIDVYVDAVFHPLLQPHILDQEGWHYELDDPNGTMIYKGVVFNEMKGAYSDPDDLLGDRAQQSLFPGHIYGLDSGGDPKVIPDLTYEQFKAFHDTFYHPSNTYIFFYGDDPADERLRLMDAYLQGFEHLDVHSDIPLAAPFESPKAVTLPYAAGEGEDSSYLTVNWLMDEHKDPELTLSLGILDHILLGTPASPLRKALIDSGLGEDLAGGGLEEHLRQMVFCTGLKGIAKADAGKVETLIDETLAELAKNGIDPDTVAASVNTIEFLLRENNTGAFPRGLLLMLRSLWFWLYGHDPLAPLAFEEPLKAIKAKLDGGDKYFEGLIQQYLIDNHHRTTLLLEPDPELNQRDDAAEAAKLAEIQAGMSAEELQAVVENTKQLKQIQETPDSPEALATLPVLKLEDLDKYNQPIPLDVLDLGGSRVLYHDLFTNGILYLDVGFNLHTLPQEYIPYVGLFGRALVEIGTEAQDFVKLSQRIGRDTGGIQPAVFTAANRDSKESAAYLFLRGKSTVDQTDKLLGILEDVLLTVKLDNQERFRQMVLEEKADQEAQLVPRGHIVVNNRLKSKFDEAGWLTEQMGGVDYLFFLRELETKVEQDWAGVLADLEAVKAALINRATMLCNVTVDGANWVTTEPQLNAFLAHIPLKDVPTVDWQPNYGAANEGLAIPAQVNFVGKGANLYDLGYELDGSIAVINGYLGTTYLWEKLRVQGGAYGGFSTFDMRSGIFNFLSYRDPNLLGSIQNYDGTAEFLRGLDLSKEELVKSIIGAIGNIDQYRLPDAKGYTSMARYLTGVDDEYLQQYRDEVLGTTEADFKALARVLDQVKEKGRVVVLGSAEDIASANQAHGDWLDVKKVL
ncbi:MAG: insulinase family protein [Anaerolineales bacterium]|nr:insulinase family protein [Anaerolineales bacterium]